MYWTHTHCAAASRTDCPSGLVNKETGSPGRDTQTETHRHAEHTEEKPGQDEDDERKNERMRGGFRDRERSGRTNGRALVDGGSHERRFFIFQQGKIEGGGQVQDHRTT